MSAPAGRGRTFAYWITTGIIAAEMGVGGVWDLIPIPYVKALVVDRLGYPAIVLTIMGAWKIPAAIALVAPGLARAKEWAYSCAVFTYAGAVASHLLAGEGIGPLLFIPLAMASWALRSPSRRDLIGFPISGVADGYWVMTNSLGTGLLIGGVSGVVQLPWMMESMIHLGYPPYFAVIIGASQLLGAIAVLAPRLPRLKEWAYAGTVFLFSGSAASHWAVGDGAVAIALPLVFIGIVAASWRLRPPDRFAPLPN